MVPIDTATENIKAFIASRENQEETYRMNKQKEFERNFFRDMVLSGMTVAAAQDMIQVMRERYPF